MLLAILIVLLVCRRRYYYGPVWHHPMYRGYIPYPGYYSRGWHPYYGHSRGYGYRPHWWWDQVR